MSKSPTPSILYQALPNAVQEVNRLGFYNALLVCFDVDTETIEERETFARNYLNKHNHALHSAQLAFRLQDSCIETWFLGNRKFCKHSPQDPILREWTQHYNVRKQDPEAMDKPPAFEGQRQQFHKSYFKKMARERKVFYRESKPDIAASEEYLAQLQFRHAETQHLQGFGAFARFFEDLNLS